jgi:hypothetical protein
MLIRFIGEYAKPKYEELNGRDVFVGDRLTAISLPNTSCVARLLEQELSPNTTIILTHQP